MYGEFPKITLSISRCLSIFYKKILSILCKKDRIDGIYAGGADEINVFRLAENQQSMAAEGPPSGPAGIFEQAPAGYGYDTVLP